MPLDPTQVQEAQALTVEAKSVMSEVLSTGPIQSRDQFATLADVAAQVKGRLEALEERRAAITTPLHTALKSVNDLFRTPREAFETALDSLKFRLASYRTSEEAKERASRASLLQANAAHELVALSAQSAPVSDHITFRDDYDIDVEDPDLVPREYLDVSSAKLKAAVKAAKGRVQIPGVRVVKTKSVAVFGKR